ncbi:hypothetical protein D3C81_2135450 [compost metagenome]
MLGYDLRCFGLALASNSIAGKPEVEAQDCERGGINWVPTGHPFSQVLKDYLAFRYSGALDNKASFVEWLVAQPRDEKPLTRTTAQGAGNS